MDAFRDYLVELSKEPWFQDLAKWIESHYAELGVVLIVLAILLLVLMIARIFSPKKPQYELGGIGARIQKIELAINDLKSQRDAFQHQIDGEIKYLKEAIDQIRHPRN